MHHATLDDFSGNQLLLIAVISDSSVFPFALDDFYSSVNVLGGERDLELVVTNQLDGTNASSSLNENGLENLT